MTTKHTPGPWQSEWPDFGDHRYVASTVSTVCDETAVCTLRADQEADARLIAAAPDLLDALKQIVPLVVNRILEPDSDQGVKDIVLAAYDAVAKAEGRS